jgi:hypothetical protein
MPVRAAAPRGSCRPSRPLVGDRIEIDRAIGQCRGLEQLAHRPAELAPFQREHHHRLLGIADHLLDEGVRLRASTAAGRLAAAARGRGAGASKRKPGVEREIAISSSFISADDVLEQRRAQIALAGVGQHAQDVAPGGARLGDLQRAGERRAAGDAGENALLGAPARATGASASPR